MGCTTSASAVEPYQVTEFGGNHHVEESELRRKQRHSRQNPSHSARQTTQGGAETNTSVSSIPSPHNYDPLTHGYTDIRRSQSSRGGRLSRLRSRTSLPGSVERLGAPQHSSRPRQSFSGSLLSGSSLHVIGDEDEDKEEEMDEPSPSMSEHHVDASGRVVTLGEHEQDVKNKIRHGKPLPLALRYSADSANAQDLLGPDDQRRPEPSQSRVSRTGLSSQVGYEVDTQAEANETDSARSRARKLSGRVDGAELFRATELEEKWEHRSRSREHSLSLSRRSLSQSRSQSAMTVQPLDDMRWENLLQVAQLGKGRYGDVLHVVDKATGEEYAVKQLTAQSNHRVHNEIHLLRLMSNDPNTTALHGVFQSKDQVFIVMELCRGGSVYEALAKNGRFREDQARRCIKQVAQALRTLHRVGVIHRDVKPENILITDARPSHFAVKLGDFGLAACIAPGGMRHSYAGTVPYMAPEILSSKPYNVAVDMWSLGVLCFCCCCGYHPFYLAENSTQQEVKERILGGIWQFHLHAWAHISEDAKSFVSQLLVVDPAARLTAEQALKHPWLASSSRSKLTQPADAESKGQSAATPSR